MYLLDILFRCIDRCNQGYSDFPAKIFQPFIFSSWRNVGFVQQQEPVTCCVGFFQCDLQFCNKICFAVSILRFVDICPDTGSGSANLIADYRFVLTFNILTRFRISTSKATERSTSLFEVFSMRIFLSGDDITEKNMYYKQKNSQFSFSNHTERSGVLHSGMKWLATA